MLSLYSIWTIARFEIKTLSRSWFLRIFAGLGFGLLFLFDLIIFTEITGGRPPREFYGISSSLPYYNLLFFNVVQAIIAIFLASDFLKRDKTLDTTEAIYIRSMTNSDYVLGKTVGIFTIFIVLNLLILSLALLFNILSPSSTINFAAYALYPFVISLPTLIFILGLSLLIMTIIRNQAVTFILLLGYVSLTLFYLGGKYYNIFDYTGFYIPMLYSDFVGFGNELDLLLHRSSYLFFGLSFIFLTMFLFRRLPQSIIMKRISLLLSVLAFIIGIITGFLYMNKFVEGENLRVEMVELNKKYSEYPVVSVIDHEIELEHLKNNISSRSKLKIVNKNNKGVKELIFCLNPGLSILKVHSNGTELDYERELHILKIMLKSPLSSKEEKAIDIEYAGDIDEEACYLDIDDNLRHKLKKIVMYTSHKSYSFISPNYLILTAESLWYPKSGVTFNPLAQFEQVTEFTNYSLTVKTDPKLTVISQGVSRDEENGTITFRPEFSLPKISLIIGDYENRSISVDSIDYNLYSLRDHNYFDEYFNEIGDTLSALIRETKQDYEREINLDYPFKRFSLVETPIQFTQYSRSWTVSFESTQPEMSLLPENGVNLYEADFHRNKARQERFGDRRNQVTLPRENQSNLFNRFITSNFLDGPNSSGYRRRRDIRQNFINPYTIFPNYYSFVSFVNSNDLPLLNSVLELYMKIEPRNTEPFVRDVMGLTNMERAIQKFKGSSLKDIIADTTNNKYMKDFLRIKGLYLFTAIGSKVGESNFRDLIKQISEENRFSSISLDQLSDRLLTDYGLDMMPFIDRWFYSDKLPGFYVSDLETKKIIDNQRERYQTEFNLTNPEEVEGYLKIVFKSRGEPERRRGRRFRSPQEEDEGIDERTIFIDAKQTKRIGVLLDEEPGNLSINTILSQNLPLQIEIPLEDFKESKRGTPFDGEEILIEDASFSNENELIVDNEESGFEVFNPGTKSWLKRTLNMTNEDEEKYIGIRYWWAPENWRATIHSEAFGIYVRSAHYTRAGDGNIKVAWNVEIEESGYYDVYTHVIKFESRWVDEDKGQNQYHYSIIHDDGQDDVNLDVGNAEKGWNLLGSFYFSEGKATVELTNESSDRVIFADAIKWIKTD